MRASSAVSSLDSPESISRTGQEFGPSQAYVWPQIKRYFHKLDRLMTAISYAEAGKLDEVQKILDEDKATKKLEHSPVGTGGMARR